MPNNDALQLEERVRRLERLVAQLLEEREARPAAAAARPPHHPLSPAPQPALAARPTLPARPAVATRLTSGPGSINWTVQGENWLARAGVALILAGMAFLFKYSIDQGWITPAVRCIIGLATGVALLATGLRLGAERRNLGAILLGGALATLYVVGFAAAILYGLIGPWMAFLYLAAVSALAFVLAEHRQVASLAIVGAAGAFATPLLLGVEEAGGLTAPYVVLIVTWTAWTHLRRAWPLLPWVAGAGSAAVLASLAGPPDGRVLLQAVVLHSWLAVAVLPLVRPLLSGTDPGRWPAGPPLRVNGLNLEPLALRALALLGSFGLILGTTTIWEQFGSRVTGLLLLVCGVVYALLAFRERGLGEPVWGIAGQVSALLVVLSLPWLIDSPWSIGAVAVFSVGLLRFSERFGSPGFRILGHSGLAITGVAVLMALSEAAAAGPVTPMVHMGAVVIAAAAWAGYSLRDPSARAAYRLAALVGLLLWLRGELVHLPNGELLVSLGWGLTGAGILVRGVQTSGRGMQQVALATLGLTVAKMVLVDTAQVESLWRILLFTGFGACLLGLSYYLRRNWAVAPARSAAGPAGTPGSPG